MSGCKCINIKMHLASEPSATVLTFCILVTVERTPLLDDTGGPPEPSFMQKVTRLLTADGEPGWASSTRFILLSSWSKVLILFVPLSLIADRLQWDAGLRFAFGILALIALIKVGCEFAQHGKSK